MVITIPNWKGVKSQRSDYKEKKPNYFTGFGGQGATDTSSRDSGLSLDGGSNADQISDGLNSMGLGGKGNLNSSQSYGNQGMNLLNSSGIKWDQSKT